MTTTRIARLAKAIRTATRRRDHARGPGSDHFSTTMDSIITGKES